MRAVQVLPEFSRGDAIGNAKEERAIVTDQPGTTRDVIEETVKIDDLLLRVMDTAGIRHADDTVEKIGIERAKKRAEEADLVLLVIDATKEADTELLQMVRQKKTIVLLNKSDLLSEDELKHVEETYRQLLAACADSGEEKAFDPVWIRTALQNGDGPEQLKESLKELFFHGELLSKETFYITNVRHKEALEEAKASLTCVMRAIRDGASEELYAPDLMEAYTALGKITGEAVEEDLLDKIFSEFCLGK